MSEQMPVRKGKKIGPPGPPGVKGATVSLQYTLIQIGLYFTLCVVILIVFITMIAISCSSS